MFCPYRLQIYSQAVKAVRAVEAAQDADAIIISDSNSVFIDCILQECGVADVFSTVLTNPASFSSEGLLSVAWHHTHDCQRCKTTPHMCKGEVRVDSPSLVLLCFDTIIGTILKCYFADSAEKYSRVVYIGDGQNDLCPMLQLKKGDVGVVRRGHGLEKALASGSHDMKATIHIVDFIHDLGNFVTAQCL